MWLVNLLRKPAAASGAVGDCAVARRAPGFVLALPEAYQSATDRSGPGLAARSRRVPRDVGIWLIVLLFRGARPLRRAGAVELPPADGMLRHPADRTGDRRGIGSRSSTAIRYADVRIAEGGALKLDLRSQWLVCFHDVSHGQLAQNRPALPRQLRDPAARTGARLPI